MVGKRLGHANIVTTGDIYGHLLPGWLKEAADALAKAMEQGYLKNVGKNDHKV